MPSIEQDFRRSMNEIYQSFPQKTQKWVVGRVCIVWKCFTLWILLTVISWLAMALFIVYGPYHQSLGEMIQRFGGVLIFTSVLFEAVFIVKMNKLTSINHPAQLTCEIYIKRKLRWLVTLSVVLTFLFVGIGTIISSFGDLIF